MTEPDMNISLRIVGRPEGTITSRFLGMEPYLLVSVQDADDDSVSFDLEAGGGVPVEPLDELAAFFEGLAEAIRAGVADGVEVIHTSSADED